MHLFAALLVLSSVTPLPSRARVAEEPRMPPATTALRVVSGVMASGQATEQWLAMIRKRLPAASFDSVAPIRKPLTPEEGAWAALIEARAVAWQGMIAPLARLFEPATPPPEVLIVYGNRGAEDGFTHDEKTIGFDLAAMVANYGGADLPANLPRIDRFFRHEFVHILQKAWWPSHPWDTDTPLGYALADIWAEGLGNYHSLSEQWRDEGGRPTALVASTLAELEPRFVARLSALACATPVAAKPLLADLSWGPFRKKWGALPAALWLAAEAGPPDSALRRLIVAGPAGVWDLADRHLSEPLRATLKEARAASARCGTP